MEVNRSWTPERKLWAAVLLHALREVAKGNHAAKAWVLNKDDTHIGSVSWICSWLGYSHAKLVERMELLTKENYKKILTVKHSKGYQK